MLSFGYLLQSNWSQCYLNQFWCFRIHRPSLVAVVGLPRVVTEGRPQINASGTPPLAEDFRRTGTECRTYRVHTAQVLHLTAA